MFKDHMLSAFICSLVISISPLTSAHAAEIVAPDGEVEFDDKGTARFSGGTELFSFHYHEPDPTDTEGLLYDTPGEMVEINPVELFEKYPGRALDDAPGMEELKQQSLRGGVAASFSDMVLTELAVLQKNCIGTNGEPGANVSIVPVYSNMRIHTNPIRTNAVMNVFSYKEIRCLVNGNLVTVPLLRRWVIAVERGLEQGPISRVIGGVTMTYKLFAQGKNIKLMAYYSNLTLTGPRWQPTMKLISGYDEFGNLDPRNKYYDRNRQSCIDIDFKDAPPNDVTIWSVPPNHMRFCARGCIPGDISATQ